MDVSSCSTFTATTIAATGRTRCLPIRTRRPRSTSAPSPWIVTRWAHVVDPFMEKLRAFEFRGRHMDVRENVAFQGRGEQTRFIHEAFPETGCAIAIEFKKFFMDEWTGLPDRQALVAMRAMIRSTLPVLEESLRSDE